MRVMQSTIRTKLARNMSTRTAYLEPPPFKNVQRNNTVRINNVLFQRLGNNELPVMYEEQVYCQEVTLQYPLCTIYSRSYLNLCID